MNRQDTADIDERIEEQAAEWILRLNDGRLSDGTLQEWREWIGEHPTHRQVFSRMSDLWGMADDLDAFETRWASLPGTESELENSSKHNSWSLAGLFRISKLVPVLSLLVAVSVIGYFYFPGFSAGVVSQQFSASYQTNTGEHQTVELPDGSVIEIGARSVVQVVYSQQERHIELRKGEGLFHVAEDADRPFTVKAGMGLYRVLGTVFNVQLGATNSSLTVVEGVVQVSANQDLRSEDSDYNGKNYPRLVAGESIQVSGEGVVGAVTRIDPDSVTAWRKGILSFVDTPLADVVVSLNRYSTRQIHIIDKDVGDLRYTGTISHDGIADMVDVLPSVFPVRINQHGNDIFIAAINEQNNRE